MSNEFREKAIARYQVALASDSLSDELRASIYAKLAQAHLQRASGAPAENIDLAIEYFAKALDYEPLPKERARIHHNLGIALRQRESGVRIENIEQSIRHCQQALEYRHEHTMPLGWSDTQRSLGEAYVLRVQGDKADNVEYAINCYQRALRAATFEADPTRWAKTNMALAAAYMAHPERTRQRMLQAAIHCHQAQRVFTQASDPERWALCQQIVQAQLSADPAIKAIEALTARFKSRAAGDDPFSGIADQLLEYVQNPQNLPTGNTAEEATEGLIAIFAEKIRKTVAHKLVKPELADDRYLKVHVVRDWDINAQVATRPPYHIYVSTNLVRFCATMSELLMFGMGLSMTEEDGAKPGFDVEPAISTDEISRYCRQVLDAFLREQEIPQIPTDSGPAHYVMSFIAFFSTMTYLVSHEMGHIIFAEYKLRGETPPFSEFAGDMLAAVFSDLVEGQRHTFDPRGLEGRDQLDLTEVQASWVEEITADIVGTSLALEYQHDEGPWAGAPDIVTQTRLGIHLALVAQMILSVYGNLKRGFSLMSPTHPPLDFRTFCVLKWMYRDVVEEAERPVAQYAQSILQKMLTHTGRHSL